MKICNASNVAFVGAIDWWTLTRLDAAFYKQYGSRFNRSSLWLWKGTALKAANITCPGREEGWDADFGCFMQVRRIWSISCDQFSPFRHGGAATATPVVFLHLLLPD